MRLLNHVMKSHASPLAGLRNCTLQLAHQVLLPDLGRLPPGAGRLLPLDIRATLLHGDELAISWVHRVVVHPAHAADLGLCGAAEAPSALLWLVVDAAMIVSASELDVPLLAPVLAPRVLDHEVRVIGALNLLLPEALGDDRVVDDSVLGTPSKDATTVHEPVAGIGRDHHKPMLVERLQEWQALIFPK